MAQFNRMSYEEGKQFNIKLADTVFTIKHAYPFIKNQCIEYLTREECQYKCYVTQDQIERENTDKLYPLDYCESIALYREISYNMLQNDGFVFHGAVISYKGKGYLFAGNSGVGKTTHILKWVSLFPKDVQIINGDKPILRKHGNVWFAYGSPWMGKENLGTNNSVQLSGICFLEQESYNATSVVNQSDAVALLMHQVLKPRTRSEWSSIATLMSHVIQNIPVIKLKCTISDEAVYTARDAFSKVDTYEI